MEDRFRVIRVINRITQEYLEMKTKISQAQISRFENGLAEPTEAQKKRLAKALGFPVSDIWPDNSKSKSIGTTILTGKYFAPKDFEPEKSEAESRG